MPYYPRRRRPVEERFWSKVDKRGDNECWPWTASLHSGYGYIYLGPDADPIWARAPRFSYELVTGTKIPPKMQIDHLCRNRACVNPAHLEVVTQHENILRGESLSAKRARQTHCYRGHEFTPENTIYTNGGRGRICRTCKNDKRREQRQTAPPAPRAVNKRTGKWVSLLLTTARKDHRCEQCSLPILCGESHFYVTAMFPFRVCERCGRRASEDGPQDDRYLSVTGMEF